MKNNLFEVSNTYSISKICNIQNSNKQMIYDFRKPVLL